MFEDLVRDIKNQQVTHILHVTAVPRNKRRELLEYVFETIANTPITKTMHGRQVSITWKPATNMETGTTEMYYSDNIFSNDVVGNHTSAMVKDLNGQVETGGKIEILLSLPVCAGSTLEDTNLCE